MRSAEVYAMRRALSLLLVTLIVSPPVDVRSAPAGGTIRGAVTVSSRPIDGVAVAFVDVSSGALYRARSGSDGVFEAQVPAGRYVVTAETQAGLVVDKAPSVLAVGPGQIVAANVELAPVAGASVQTPEPAQNLPGQPPAAPVTATTINHDAVGCMVAGQFPLLDARIEPASSVARARVYFKAAQGDAWYYVEMTPAENGFVGKLPRPKLEASPITYYIQATTTEFGEGKTAEIPAIVVLEAKDCPEDRKLAAIGPPGEVTVFSAATGAALAPVGFAAGGLALTAATIALLIGGAAAVGIGAAVTVFNPEPTPSPSPSPSPTPTPTTPTPRPPASPSPEPEPEPHAAAAAARHAVPLAGGAQPTSRSPGSSGCRPCRR